MGVIVDLFAGGGGASQGIHKATGRHPDAAVNHDPVAVSVHAANHPATQHFCQDVWTVHPAWVSRGRAVDLLWASPDCTHHSKAKGGAPTRDERRRDLAMVLPDKWVAALRPRIIVLENVEEFEDWGPLKDGKIVESAKGQKFREFLNRFRRYGYVVEYRILRACDYGAPTTRLRLYLIARCDGRPIVWPNPTHGAPGSPAVLAGLLKPWRTAAECIDFSLPCPSIFATSEEIFAQYGIRARRPLKEATMRRIFRGLHKFVLNNPKPFIVKNYTGALGQPTDKPLGTVTTIDHHALVEPFLASYYGDKGGPGFRGRALGEPLPTQTTENRFSLQLPLIQHMQHGGEKNSARVGVMPADEPLRTVTALPKGGGMALVSPVITSPAHSTTTGRAEYVYGPHEPLSKMRGTNIGQSSGDPLQTLSAGGTHFAEVRCFLQKYYGEGGQDQTVARPLDTVTTKARFGIVTVHGQDYAIMDIGMRMLQPRELARAMGFPDSYIIERGADGKPTSKTEQVRLIGNAVCPDVAAALVAANYVESGMEEILNTADVAASM